MDDNTTPSLPAANAAPAKPNPVPGTPDATPSAPAPSQVAADVKPDGGPLGHAIIGSLAGAQAAQADATAPQAPAFIPDTTPSNGEGGGSMPPAFIPANGQDTSATDTTAPPKPGFWDQMGKAEDAGASNPLNAPAFIIGGLHLYSGILADWASKKVDQDQQDELRGAAQGKTPSWMSPYRDIATGSLRDTAEMAHGLVGPKGLTATGAAIVAPVPAGLFMIGHGLYNMIQDWGSLANPDVLQSELGSASEIAMGGTMAVGGTEAAIKRVRARAVANAPNEQFEAFKTGIPNSKAAPYSQETFEKAQPLIQESMVGKDMTIKSQIEAADNAIGKIEAKVSKVVSGNPDAIITDNAGHSVDVLGEVRNALSGSVRGTFLEAGLKELNDLPLKGDVTLQAADDIRLQLNRENSAMMKAKNNYDFANMVATDPAFAARVAAAEALRSGLYNTLQRLGLPDAQQMRLDEGSVMKIRNALLRQEFAAEKPVRTASKMGKVKSFVKRSLGPLGAAAGFEAGAAVGHPVLGASAGARAGNVLGEALEPRYLTRDQLAEKAFEPAPKPMSATIATPAVLGAAAVAGEANQNITASHIHVRSSDGREFYIPAAQLQQAYTADPHLEIIRH